MAPSATNDLRAVVRRLQVHERLHLWATAAALPAAILGLAGAWHWQEGTPWLEALLSGALWCVLTGGLVLGYLGQAYGSRRRGLAQACNGRIVVMREGDALSIRAWKHRAVVRAEDVESLCLYWDGGWDGMRGIVDAMAIRLRSGQVLRIPEDAEGFHEITVFASNFGLPQSRVEVE